MSRLRTIRPAGSRGRWSARWGWLILAVAVAAFLGGMWFDRHSAHHAGQLTPLVSRQPHGRVPGEFEHQDALLLGCNELVEFYPQTLVDIVSAIDGKIQIVALVTSDEQREKTANLLRSRGIDSDAMHYFVWPATSMWVQDFGPLFLVDTQPTIVDFEYLPEPRTREPGSGGLRGEKWRPARPQ